MWIIIQNEGEKSNGQIECGWKDEVRKKIHKILLGKE
jgi:hypothetical protein